MKAYLLLVMCCFVFIWGTPLLFLFSVVYVIYHTVTFITASHSSRAPTSGSQTGDTLGKALASVSAESCLRM